VTGPDALRLALGDRPGETVELTVLRGGAIVTLRVGLGSRA
jgi:S1-C subfamily serine protease